MAPTCQLSSRVREFVSRWAMRSKVQQSDSADETKLSESSYMDPELWKYLPDVLVEQIRSRLPFPSLVRLCAVSKSWRSAILCPHQYAPSSRLQSSNGLLIQTSDSPIKAFKSGKWESLPNFPGPIGSLQVLASGGGILCMRSSVRRELVLWNPLTRRVRHVKIPEIEPGEHDIIIEGMSVLNVDGSCYRVGLVFNSSENRYRLIVAIVSKGAPGLTLVYDSVSSSWKRTQAVPAGYSFFLNSLSSETGFHCAVHSDHDMLLKYEVHQETWSATRMPVSTSTPKSLISIRGEVMLLTELQRLHGTAEKFYALSFQLSGWSSTVEEVVPQRLVKRVLKTANSCHEGLRDAEMHCLVQGDTVYFVGTTMAARNRWLRLQRRSTSMRFWVHGVDGENWDSEWSCVGFKTDNIDWTCSSRMMRSDLSRLSAFIIVPSLTSDP
ncbi:hypothetical protein MPTK1_3g04640 [Marchantia polymorpha subsp. ruderalis]|uniref:F-box domain-containing protein n=2 Tax=Marchantia polymorpha TaxID=3197 RepID=A0AAF6AXF7_MARPO|nr:hypothetical protein MARPO_0022s0065 [Marchantia polymorpha]BBN04441.1 hypothetical protein Mp_3g04640 [Marchantia polymorpha subsp. ruderalis]|eukprot:PTQ43961.1 hypothetical protein MARPO_0022s0065 [Marchantia polymorpha]